MDVVWFGMDRVKLVDLNPFGEGVTDPVLFTWDENSSTVSALSGVEDGEVQSRPTQGFSPRDCASSHFPRTSSI